MRFIGTIEAKVDTKGRTIVPAVFRKVLQELGEERVVLRKDDFQPCFVIYPESTWSCLVDTMRSRLNRWDPQQQMMFRLWQTWRCNSPTRWAASSYRAGTNR